MEIEVVWRAFLITWVNIAPYITFTNTKGLLQLFGKIRSLFWALRMLYIQSNYLERKVPTWNVCIQTPNLMFPG